MISPSFEFPEEQRDALRKAKRLEWLTIVYLLSTVVLMYVVMGSSQAMRTAWIEDMLSIIPSTAFLIASHFCFKKPSKKFPYGFHRATSLAFLFASFALLAMGLYLFAESVIKLIMVEHPSIGSMRVFGYNVWLGWLMIPSLIYSGLPAMMLGRKKLPLARKMHDKVLFADASMNKADWLTASAGIAGILGIAYGLWWADAAAAAIISLDIVKDGYVNVKSVLEDLLNEVPRTVDHSSVDPLPERVAAFFRSLPWVKDVDIRMREEGHVFFGEALVVTGSEAGLPALISRAANEAKKLDWRLHDLIVSPVQSIERAKPEESRE